MQNIMLSKFETYLLDEEQQELNVQVEEQIELELEELGLQKKDFPAGFFSSL